TADLLYSAAEEHHLVGGVEAGAWVERRLELTGAEFELERAQRQVEAVQPRPQLLHDVVDPVELVLGEELVPVSERRHDRRIARLARCLVRQPRVVEAEDVELDLEADAMLVAALGEIRERAPVELARRERDDDAVGKVDVTE